VIRIAIPIFRMRVSPVFDTAVRILIVDFEKSREVDRKELYLNAMSLTERIKILRKAAVSRVICGGISDMLANMLSNAKIDLVADIAGEVEQVLAAYRTNCLDDPRFRMPGARAHSLEKAFQSKECGHEIKQR
jgi:predicted Fe-Mo cluster-binding NifX family protein